jgi:gliding motility-associated-like protein
MSKSIFGIIIALFASLLVRAEQPIFNISSTDANPGDIIDVNFQVDNFSQIISVQYSVNWDPAVLDFRSIKNFNPSVPGLSPSVFGTPQALIDAGKFTLSWIESSITPITIPDGSLFFTVEFEVVGDPCQSSPVAITNDPLEIEVAEVGEVPVGLVSNDGQVNIPGSGCAQGIVFTGNSVVGACGGNGGNTCIQFTVDNFITVGAMEFSLVYNPDVIQFNEFRNFAPLPGFGEGNTNLLAPGTIRVLWFDSNVENDTLPDGTVLFEICFDVIGTGGQSSEITFGNNPVAAISDIDGNPHEVSIVPAVITAQCQLEGFALLTDTVCTTPNGTACFDIKVNDFDDIIALQFSLNWDPNVFEYDHLEAFGIPGLDQSGFGTPGFPDVDEGELTLSWIDLSLEGVTLPDFATIFRLCLKAKGASGTSSPVTFSANPLAIEAATLDSVLVPSLLHGLGEIKQSCDPCSLSYVLNVIHPSCPRNCDGVLNLTVMEGCPETPTYLWNNGATTQDITGACAGNYIVTITLGTQIVIVTQTLVDPPAIAVTGTVTNPIPPGSSTGAVDITVTGGTPAYTYLWSNGAITQDISGVGAGVYTVTVTDNLGCTFIPDPYIVGAELVAAITNVSCNGGTNGAINLSPAFGTPPYTFVWNTIPAQTTEDLNNLKAGTYCVTVSDSGGSTRDTCFTVTEPGVIVLNGTVTNDVNENCQGAIDLNVTGGTLPYTYSWSNGLTSQDLTQLCPGQYCVTVTDGQGCAANSCFTVFAGGIGVSLVATQFGSYQTSCSNICDGEITSVVSGGGTTFTYAWSNGATTPDISNLCAGTYSLTVTDESARTATATIVLVSPPPITLNYITTNPTDYITSNGAISVIVNGGTPPYTYQWTGPVSGNTASLNNVPAGTYTVLVTDANGCEVLDSEQLLPDVDVPCYTATRVFTPNSDGKNDYFIIACVLDLENHLSIFNRFGGLVYETDDYQNNWIGVDQDNEAVPDGGYMWVLEVTRQDGSKELYKGTVNLVRTAD